jgi:late competence protein required for DNA uptake (superfamily II DNA/RNA helicase)
MVDAAVVPLRQQRCVNHPQREASARCPECGRFYCRECITEHDDRVLCASCLARLSLKKEAARRRWSWLPRLVLAAAAFALVFLVLLVIGNYLLSIPSEFHNTGDR